MSIGTPAGILACGRYLPRLRIARRTIADGNSWLAPRARTKVKGTRSFCEWDEDAVTMATAAAMDTVARDDHPRVSGVYLASTTLPFAERQNAGIVAAALGLNSRPVATFDFSGSGRAGTSAMISALGCTDGEGDTLVIAADRRNSRPNSADELSGGHGAAAVLIGQGDERSMPIARLMGKRSVAEDLLDFVRASDQAVGSGWEERWVREQLVDRMLPRAIADALADAGVPPAAVAHLVVPLPHIGGVGRIAAGLGIRPEAVAADLADECGHTGAAHPLLMLSYVLERASPGETIVLVGIGQGCDTIVLQTTEALPPWRASRPTQAALPPIAVNDYTRFLCNAGQLTPDLGLRARKTQMLPFSAVHRHRDHVLALVGGRCRQCGTLQLPKTRICVAPNCHFIGDQDDVSFAAFPGRVASWTADYLVASRAPPAIYGTVHFECGGSYMFNFADVREEEMDVGLPVRMVFRVHDIDETNGFVSYFWKASLRQARNEAFSGEVDFRFAAENASAQQAANQE